MEDEKAKKEDRPSSLHLSARSGTIQTKKDLAMTYLNQEKYTITVSGKYSGRRLLGQFSASIGQRTTILADKVKCRNCIQCCAGRLHLQGNFSKRRTNSIRETLDASSAPKIVLKSAWQSQQEQQQDTSESVSSRTRQLVRRVEREQRGDQGS